MRMSDDNLEPAAYILQMAKRDGTLQKTAMLRERAEGKIVEQPLFSADQLRHLLDLEELIDQLAFAHRELQRLEDEGIDDTGNLEDRIEANRELQCAVETLRATIGAEESAQTSQEEGDNQ